VLWLLKIKITAQVRIDSHKMLPKGVKKEDR